MASGFVDNRFMSPENFFMINGGVVVLLAIYFLWLKKEKAQPSKLNLRKGNSPKKSQETALDFTSEQELNVFFNHNSVMFDAYDILGIPAGSSLDEVEKAYRDSLAAVHDDSEDIIHRAYRAIKERIKS